ncbi:MAG: Gfo/Idh/MocA family protein, partial [Planctomycetota bacterium]
MVTRKKIQMSKDNTISRRAFLREAVSTLAFPYVVSSSALGKAGNVAPSNRITMGCIGVGGQRPGGQGTSDMQGFLGRDVVQVIAVCDVDTVHRNRARDIVNQKYGNKDCSTYNDFRELLARDDIDAVSIVLPDHWHAIAAVTAARAGKDIFSQKPLAYSIAEGRAICDAVKRYGVVWQTGNSMRSSQNVRFVCELVRNGRIGKLHTVKVGLPNLNRIADNGDRIHRETKPAPVPKGLDYDMWLGPAPWSPYSPGRCHWNFRWVNDYSGGQITDWAGHYCDVAQWGMGTERTGPVEIEGSGVFPTGSLFDTVENYRFVCKYAKGLTMIVAGPFADGVRFEGSDGWLFVRSGGMDAHPKSLLDSVIAVDEIHLHKSNDHKGNFLDCIRTRSEAVSPADIAQRSVSVGHLGLIAIRSGRKLKWNPGKERFINDE